MSGDCRPSLGWSTRRRGRVAAESGRSDPGTVEARGTARLRNHLRASEERALGPASASVEPDPNEWARPASRVNEGGTAGLRRSVVPRVRTTDSKERPAHEQLSELRGPP